MTLKDLTIILLDSDIVHLSKPDGWPLANDSWDLPVSKIPERYESYKVLRINPCLSIDSDVDSEHKTYALQVLLDEGGDNYMTVKEMRIRYGLTQQALSDLTGIPKRTIENWDGGQTKPAPYLLKLLESYLEHNKGEGH